MRLTGISFCKTFDLGSSYSFEGHTHNTCEANIILEGNMEVSVEGNVIKLSKGDMLVWSPGMFHFNRVEENNRVKLLSVHFSIDDSPFDRNNMCFYHLSYEKTAIVNEFIKEVNQNGFESRGAADSLLEALIYMCVNNSGKPQFSEDPSAVIYSKVMEMMSSNQNKILIIPEMAQNCGVCATTLKNAFKRHSGKSIKKYYSELKLETAKEMLHKGMTAQQIAFKLGFSSSSYFSQFFKNSTGVSIREYMKG
ncbi:MAG: helix-turn-helix domain-containing protein [Clostridia bacterium]|nr:helix-turn-helix domain-containing protein [Clostridia bacterium]